MRLRPVWGGGHSFLWQVGTWRVKGSVELEILVYDCVLLLKQLHFFARCVEHPINL